MHKVECEFVGPGGGVFENISPGVYYPGTSVLHRLQARTKLLALLWLIGFLIVANQRLGHFAPYVALLGLLALGVAVSGVGAGELWRRLRLLALLTAIGAVFTLLFVVGRPIYTAGPLRVSYAQARWALLAYCLVVAVLLAVLRLLAVRRLRRRRGARPAAAALAVGALAALVAFGLTRGMPGVATFPLGPVVITLEGVWIVVTASMVLLVFYAFALLLTMTTTPAALVEGLNRLLAPLRRVGAPVDDFTLMTLIALRFIPTLLDEAERLFKAQLARGADLAHGSPRQRLQSLSAWFVPLLQATLRRAGELATALEARGYEPRGRWTALHEGPLGAADYATLALVVMVTLLSLIP
jgi:energy-coupling factor transporter transmembrane protein EcfT